MKSDDLWVYIDSDISTDRDDIEKVSRTKSQQIERCRGGVDGKKTSTYRGGVEQTESLGILLDGLSYVSIGIEKTQKNLNRRGFC